MFEAAELGRKVSKEDWQKLVPELRTQLLEAQRQLLEAPVPVIIIVAGVEGAGKGEVVNRLNEWLDTRGVQTHAFWDEPEDERERPRYWRYWRTMPARGSIAIMFGAWYFNPIYDVTYDRADETHLDAEANRINDLERMLGQDNALIIKFWFHMPKEEQKKRFRKLSKDPHSQWRMAHVSSKFSKVYDHFLHVAERMIRHTDSGVAPWYMIESTDRRYRDLTVGRTLLEAIRSRLAATAAPAPPSKPHAPRLPLTPTARVTVLDHVDLSLTVEPKEYKKEMARYQARLNELTWRTYNERRSVVMVFEGWDAAGKGGAIRRLMTAMDSRLYRVIPIAAPTDEERAHHYLWRFWRHIPRPGRVTVFDRSWYGRVLVERVEGFAHEEEWHRAYLEINEFEQQLSDHGLIVLKFWLHISQEEQLKRFEARQQTPYKEHKITEEDWRNREKWDAYKAAVNEMSVRTSTEYAPWHLVPGNDKRFARLDIIRTVCERLEKALEGNGKKK